MRIRNPSPGPYGGGWHKHFQGNRAYHPTTTPTATTKGRRLSQSDVNKIAAEMGLPVSADRYRLETESEKAKRAEAHRDAMKREAEIKPVGPRVPKRFWPNLGPGPRDQK